MAQTVPSPAPVPAEGGAAGARPLRKGDVVDVRIESLAYGGAGVGRLAEPEALVAADRLLPVYTPKGAQPGDVVRVLVKRVRRRPRPPPTSPRQSVGEIDRDADGRAYAEALFVERIRAAPDAVKAPCRHFGNARLGGGSCGGCVSMDMHYAKQLAEKQTQVDFLFRSLRSDDGLHRTAPVSPIIPCDRLFAYRNKMEFSFGRKWYVDSPEVVAQKKLPMNLSEDKFAVSAKTRKSVMSAGDRVAWDRGEAGREYALGMHAPGRYDRVVEISECHLQPSIGNEILDFVRRQCDELGFMPYDARDHSGLVRNVMIRSSMNRRSELEVMVNLQTGPCEVPRRLVPLAEELRRRFPSIVCVVQNMPATPSSVSMDPKLQRLLAGKRAFIEQKLGDLVFEISANSFFQTNAYQAETLYAEARRSACLKPTDVVLDLFCGTGTIGLSMASSCRKVIGIEIVADAVADAKRNAARNNIQNAEFFEGNLDRLRGLPVWSISGEDSADVIILDPPRAGIGPKLSKELSRTSARRIVYISCNPASCARDLEHLRELAPGRFEIDAVVPIDMFPHSPHIEVVVGVSVRGGPPAGTLLG